jgi:hypothetical protein
MLAMFEDSPCDEETWLTGTLAVVVRRRSGEPVAGARVLVKGCGFS